MDRMTDESQGGNALPGEVILLGSRRGKTVAVVSDADIASDALRRQMHVKRVTRPRQRGKRTGERAAHARVLAICDAVLAEPGVAAALRYLEER